MSTKTKTKTVKTTHTLASNPEDFDDDLMYPTDDEGNPINDSDARAEAEAVQTLAFKFRGQNHRIEVRALNVPAHLTQRLAVIGAQLAFRAGFKPGESFGSNSDEESEETTSLETAPLDGETEAVTPTDAETQTASDAGDDTRNERIVLLLRLTEESEELRELWAQIAVAATQKDAKGNFRTTVAEFRRDLTPQKLLDYGALGELYVTMVRDWLRPT